MTSLIEFNESKIDIKNDTWTLNTLLKNLKRIKKPKFQRDKKWTIRPSNKNKKANYEEFLKFLVCNKNSVAAISLGTYYENNQEYYVAIDGNNRINAVIHFLQKPYDLFPYYYDEFFSYIKNIDENKLSALSKEKIINNIKNLDYQSISSFRRIDECLDDDIEINDRHVNREIEYELIKIQNKFKYSENRLFSNNINLVINIFSNGTIEEYNNLYLDLNKYQGTFSQNELLAAILFTTNVEIQNEKLKNDLIDKIMDYYENRGNNEVLEKYTPEKIYNMKISAFDFMVSFQNYCNEKYKIIEKFSNCEDSKKKSSESNKTESNKSDSKGLSILFKVFGHLYGSCEVNKFNTENVNDFIEKILFTCKILLDVYENVLPPNISSKIFNKSAIVDFDKLIAANSLTVLFISIIVNKDLEYNKLFNSIKVTIIFHLLCNKCYLSNMTENDYLSLQIFDKLKYEAGGKFIENKCKSILEGKEKIFNNVTKEAMNLLIENNIKSINNEITFSKKDKTKKRRQLNLVDKILMSNYWNIRVSNSYIRKDYSIEHIVPFSSQWDNSLDINRLGNLVPTLQKINSERGNKDLTTYYKVEYSEFTKFIDELLPKDYNNIVNHGEKKNSKPKITNNEKFNEYCIKNENLYKRLLIESLFN